MPDITDWADWVEEGPERSTEEASAYFFPQDAEAVAQARARGHVEDCAGWEDCDCFPQYSVWWQTGRAERAEAMLGRVQNALASDELAEQLAHAVEAALPEFRTEAIRNNLVAFVNDASKQPRRRDEQQSGEQS